MKTIFLLLFLFLSCEAFSQNHTLDSLYKKQLELEMRISKASLHIEDAGKELWLSAFLPLGGALGSAIILLITKDGTKFSVYIPVLVGNIFGIVNLFMASDDLKEAGRILNKKQ